MGLQPIHTNELTSRPNRFSDSSNKLEGTLSQGFKDRRGVTDQREDL